MVRDQRYKCTYIFGVGCPARVGGATLILPHVHAQVMNLHQAGSGIQFAPRAHAVVAVNGGGWNQQRVDLRCPRLSASRR